MYGMLPRHYHSMEFAGHGAGTLVYECVAVLPGGKRCDLSVMKPCGACGDLEPGHVDGFAQLLQRCAVCQLWQDGYCDTHLRENRRVVCPSCCGWRCCKGL